MRASMGFLTAFVLVGTSVAWAGPTQSSFTPTGYKYPIMRIQISGDNGAHAKQLYACPGATADDCLVDLANANALDKVGSQAQNVVLDEDTWCCPALC